MKMSSSVWLAAALLFTASHSALAQQHTHVVAGADCEHCQNGSACENPGCCLCRIRLYPDACWNPPVNLPVNHNWAWYGLSAPQAPYGAPGGGFIAQYPSVYQPTDTTQLGYYYHKVPTWQNQPGRLPAAPIPSHFHSRMCPPTVYGFHHHVGQHSGTVMHSYAVPTLPQTTQTVSDQGAAGSTRQVSAPSPLKSVRAVSSNPEPELPSPTVAADSKPAPKLAPKPAPKSAPRSAPKSTSGRSASSLLNSLFD
ncbi:MAG: hypothetical protein ACKO2L_02500 [Planctomycetaceae bacterium]